MTSESRARAAAQQAQQECVMLVVILATLTACVLKKRPSLNRRYQFNLVAIGVLACLRLFKISGDDFYRDQAEVLLASFLHNTNI